MTRHFKSWFSSYGSVLSIGTCACCSAGLTISATGSWAYNVALLAFVYGRTHSLGWVGAAGFVRFLPALLLSPYAGVIVERTDRIRLMISHQRLGMVWQCALAVVALANGPVVLALVFSVLERGARACSRRPPSARRCRRSSPRTTSSPPTRCSRRSTTSPSSSARRSAPCCCSPARPRSCSSSTPPPSGSRRCWSRRSSTGPVAVDVTEGGTAGIFKQMGVGAKAILGARSARVLVGLCALVSFVYGTDTVLFVGVSAHKLGTGANGFGYLLAGLGIGGVLMAAGGRQARGPRQPRLGDHRRRRRLHAADGAADRDPHAGARGRRRGRPWRLDAGRRRARADGASTRGAQGAARARDGLVLCVRDRRDRARHADHAADRQRAWTRRRAADHGRRAVRCWRCSRCRRCRRVDRDTAAASAILAPKVALLEQLGIFATASRPLLERLASEAEEREFTAGTAIITEGDEADYLYVLVEGTVEVTASGESGGPAKPIRTMQAPTYFGEIGILERIPRTANVTAAERLQVPADRRRGACSTRSSPQTLHRRCCRALDRLLAATHPSVRSDEDVEPVATGSV